MKLKLVQIKCPHITTNTTQHISKREPTNHNKHKKKKKKFHRGYGFGLDWREGEREGESLRSWVQCRSKKIERVVATTAGSGGNENVEKTT